MLHRLKEYLEAWNSLSKHSQGEFTKHLETNTDAKKEIRALYKEYFNRDVSGCGWCILSAHLELVKLDITKMTNKPKQEYKLRAGAILHDPVNKDFNKLLTPQTLIAHGEQLALYHLAYNPKAINKFEKYPHDLNDRISEFLENQDSDLAKQVKKAGVNRVELIQAQYNRTKTEVSVAKKNYEDSLVRLAKLAEQLEAAGFSSDDERDINSFKESKPSGDNVNDNSLGSGLSEGQIIVSAEGQGPAQDNDRKPTEEDLTTQEQTGTEQLLGDDALLDSLLDGSGNTTEFNLDEEVKVLLEAGLTQAEILEALDENVKAKQTTKTAIKAAVSKLKA